MGTIRSAAQNHSPSNMVRHDWLAGYFSVKFPKGEKGLERIIHACGNETASQRI
jgi:hypothetical protein